MRQPHRPPARCACRRERGRGGAIPPSESVPQPLPTPRGTGRFDSAPGPSGQWPGRKQTCRRVRRRRGAGHRDERRERSGSIPAGGIGPTRGARPVPYLRDGEMGVRMSWENWDRMGMPTVEIRAEAGGRGNKQRTAHVEDYNIDALRPEDRAELRSYYLEAWALARKWTDEVVRKVTRA